jgi:hypothetical protein
VLFLIVSRFADIDILVEWEVPRAAFVVSSEEHDEAAVYYFINWVIAILARLDYFILIEVPIETMDSLLRSIVPTCIDPLSTILILPGTIDLSHNRLSEIVGIHKMHPVT